MGQGTEPTDVSEVVYAVRRDPVRDGSIFGRQHSNAVTSAAALASATPQTALCAHHIPCNSNVTLKAQHCLLAWQECVAVRTSLPQLLHRWRTSPSLLCQPCLCPASVSTSAPPSAISQLLGPKVQLQSAQLVDCRRSLLQAASQCSNRGAAGESGLSRSQPGRRGGSAHGRAQRRQRRRASVPAQRRGAADPRQLRLARAR